MGSLSVVGGNRVLGPGAFTPAVAVVLMSDWVYRVIVWPEALIEAIVVVPLGVLIVWRFVRVGVWIDDGDLVIRNAWETLRVPLNEVVLRTGYVDDISEFDRFTGGYANKFRSKVGDSFADRDFLRHRLVYNGEEHDIDAFFGRTPKAQVAQAAKLIQAIENAKLGGIWPAS